MPYHQMSDAEIWAFLRGAPARPAILSTTRRDGRPHTAPIWYDVDGESVVFNTGAKSVKGRNLARDPRVAFCVQDDRLPYSFAILDGTAEISDQLDEVRAWAARIGGRYMGADRAEEYGARNGVPGELLVRVRPSQLVGASDVAD
jgi:PPOX class probable F420-dependent enzyme